jgi:nanoRNase/pAp phosphatase (c-di-AMP/oligoRNAs hydrolase)
MRSILITDTVVPSWLVPGLKRPQEEFIVVAPLRGLLTPAQKRGARHVVRDLSSEETYRKIPLRKGDRAIICLHDRPLMNKAVKILANLDRDIPILILSDRPLNRTLVKNPNISLLSLDQLFSDGSAVAFSEIETRKKVSELRSLFRDAGTILVLTQHDPDPDALACGLAVRTLLGRNKTTAPICTFGKVTRSENLSMIKLLDIEVKTITEQSLEEFDKVIMVDVQPPYFGKLFPKVDAIIDHHPVVAEYEASFREVNIRYGATSSILTHYLRADNAEIPTRLATALLYGIKTDTFLLERETGPQDVAAFTHLYALANHALIRRMERPELSADDLKSFNSAFRNRVEVDGVLFTHLGKVKSEDIIPRLADFCLQIENVDWALVSGVFERSLVLSARNVGHVRSAGEIMRKAFGDLGSAGGHRAMAKAVLPLRTIKRQKKVTTTEELRKLVFRLFVKALKEHS